jgi:capsular exopolysaccharide synthesis family protein
VLLIDADMRKPSIHDKLGLKNTQGLSNVLAGTDNWQAMVSTDPATGLRVLPAGPPPPSAAELVNSPRLEKLLREARESYDHCVIDGPPIMGLADAPLLCSKADGTVFVVQAGGTSATASRIGLERLLDARVRVLGAVLAKFDAKRSGEGYGYIYEYGYGKKEAEMA